MVEIANRSQQVIAGAIRPLAAYSRVLSCIAFIPTGPGAVFSFTQKLGDNIRIYDVRVRTAPHTVNMANQTLFRILYGTSAVTTAARMLAEWTNLLPLVSPGFTDEPWTAYDGGGAFHWTMKRSFFGRGLRLGFWAERGPVGTDELSVSFEIAEG